ncbi:pyridoxal phosphate-dependent decarboxylase family protein [Actinomadura rudentiformis]|uniref:Aspartate aminotransferase family protein n=1 Tax=Actinomadura rudentiformis TaxID=359158 RepID=A0A6H9YRU0_9ACTN|nr:pyridoxal-dependent decarboxylase [Actinomadura rudentiformis]KAB2343695.1 aspartate aminotransferase family protein [Actinomadura rudentiformis]
MHTLDQKLARLVFDECRRQLSLDEVPLKTGGDRERLTESLAGLIGASGHDPEAVLSAFLRDVAPAIIACDTPRFMAFVSCVPSKTSILFDMVVSAFSLHGISWLEAAGPVAAENQALRVLADAAGLPAGAGGCFVSGGSSGNLSALLVARDTGLSRRGGRCGRPRVAVTADAHSSIGKALHVLGMEPLPVPVHDHRLSARALRDTLAREPDRDDVVAVVATAGTTNGGLIDDLAGVAEVARQQGLWFHVDAAYGGAGLLAPSVRGLFDGIEQADSVVIDPHKWLFSPFDCAALLYRDPPTAKAVHTQRASYLDAIHDEDDGGVGNPSDYAHHLTRRARGLPLWFGLAVHGTDAYRDNIENTLTMARYAADLITGTEGLTLVCEPELSVVLFRRDGWGWDDYEKWSARLLANQVAFVLPTSWDGEPVARLCFVHPETTKQLVDEVISTIARPLDGVT